MKLIRYLVPLPNIVGEVWGILGYKSNAYQIECNPDEHIGSIGDSVKADSEGDTSIPVDMIGEFTNSSTLYKESNETIINIFRNSSSISK